MTWNVIKKRILNLGLICLVGIFNLFLLLFPKEILITTKESINLWANNVLPALLPFLIGTNILIKTEIIDLISFVVAPITHIFNVSGNGAFAIIAGMICGYPVGAKIIKDLREENKISRTEAQILISFCNNPGPIFILGTVGVNMLGNEKLGYILMFVIYFTALLNGLIFGLILKNKVNNISRHSHAKNILVYNHKNKNYGIIIGQSISEAILSVLQIGGFIVVFAVLCKILEISNVSKFIWRLIYKTVFFDKLGYKNFKGICIGLTEVTNGIKFLTEKNYDKLSLILLTSLLSFGGFCVHMQSIAFLAKTDINTGLYIFAKLVHALITAIFMQVIFSFINPDLYIKNTQACIFQTTNFAKYVINSCKNFIALISIIMLFVILNYATKLVTKKRRRRQHS